VLSVARSRGVRGRLGGARPRVRIRATPASLSREARTPSRVESLAFCALSAALSRAQRASERASERANERESEREREREREEPTSGKPARSL